MPPRHGPLILKRCKPPLTAEGMTSNKAGTWMRLWKHLLAGLRLWCWFTVQHRARLPPHDCQYEHFLLPYTLLRALSSRHNTSDKILIIGSYHLHHWGFPVWHSSVMGEEVKYWLINQQVSISLLSIIFKASGNAPSTDPAPIPP